MTSFAASGLKCVISKGILSFYIFWPTFIGAGFGRSYSFGEKYVVLVASLVWREVHPPLRLKLGSGGSAGALGEVGENEGAISTWTLEPIAVAMTSYCLQISCM